MKTRSHAVGCAKPCKGCVEHRKYRKHRACPPHQWLMVPLTMCRDKKEGEKVERKLIRAWKPNLNGADRPLWLLKKTYVVEYKRGNPSKRTAPWARLEGEREDQDRSYQPAMPPMTTFTGEGMTVYDLETLLRHGADKGSMGMEIVIMPVCRASSRGLVCTSRY